MFVGAGRRRGRSERASVPHDPTVGQREIPRMGSGAPTVGITGFGKFPTTIAGCPDFAHLAGTGKTARTESRSTRVSLHCRYRCRRTGRGRDGAGRAAGNNLIEIRSFRQQDARGELVAALLPYQSRLGFVNVDAAGIGWYMAQHLAEYFRV